MDQEFLAQTGISTRPSLGQITALADALHKNGYAVNKLINLTDRDEIYQKLENITIKQKKYINYLIISRNWIKLAEMLSSLGFKRY
jgi:hypothetical protein